ncbi:MULTISPECIES: ATP-binding cassette domain-containing protein [unclassified Streptomyces]|uniref:ATP-binding cassette domain-containing protein n=1 Tax=unclassified Streptomyces TaxID=2593676 RepID=UPI002E2AC6C4|nr:MULTISPECIES: ATP-binding cassette domain-containing protein [unclassified Streptomyces]WUB88728.1 ATP-binding cassette domain-containing protein [Streptomyces sp. NBC_00566]
MTLEIDNCTYGYRRWKPPVLRDFSYALPDGLTVLLGPNGAGKSTLLKLAASVTRPQRGRVTLDGTPAGTAAYRQSVAWMPQDIVPMPTLTAREYVAYIGWLKGMSRAEAWQQSRRALGRVNLADQAGARTSSLSGGQLRRVGVAGALVHGARVLLLDEPTAGMDPYQRRVFRDILRGLTDDVRVLLSTHDVADLAEEADHVTVMYGGNVLHHGDTGSFLTHTPPGTLEGRAAEAAYTALLTSRGVTA